tara:strand:- start:98 stop:658 length:561 start_codon:yes stop_codon:yes gene_type:complete
MLVAPFTSEFYTIFPAPNADELIDVINKICDTKDIDNDYFDWGSRCKVDRIPLSWKDTIELYKPSIELLYEKLSKSFSYTLFDPWINLYKKGFYQEIHAHKGYDISSVFFVNDGENFSELFFSDRNSINFSYQYEKLISYVNSFNLKYKKGDIVFFPSHLLHGVTAHESDVIRKTMSVNLSITEIF